MAHALGYVYVVAAANDHLSCGSFCSPSPFCLLPSFSLAGHGCHHTPMYVVVVLVVVVFVVDLVLLWLLWLLMWLLMTIVLLMVFRALVLTLMYIMGCCRCRGCRAWWTAPAALLIEQVVWSYPSSPR